MDSKQLTSTSKKTGPAEKTFDQHASSYSDEIEKAFGRLSDSHDFFVRHKAEIILKILSEHFPVRDASILDVGCGVGLVHPYLVDHVGNLQGADISKQSIAIAEEKNSKIDYLCYDGESLPFDDNSFDCAFTICVLHHVPVILWQSFVAEMARVVRPGGLVIAIEHNPINPATQWVVRNCELDDDAVLLMPRRLKTIFSDAHLSNTETRYVLFTPFKAPFFRRLDDLLRKIPLGAQYVVQAKVADEPKQK